MERKRDVDAEPTRETFYSERSRKCDYTFYCFDADYGGRGSSFIQSSHFAKSFAAVFCIGLSDQHDFAVYGKYHVS